MNQFQNTNIQVASIEAKMSSTGNMKYILTATDKKKYHFYQKNKNKETGQPEDCDVFEVFNSMGVKQGSTINIGFTEEEKSFTNQKGEVIKYTDRFIGSMREAQGVPQISIQKPQPNTYVKTDTGEKDDKFWDKKAYKQCLWAKWLKDSVQLDLNQEDWKSVVWEAFKEIEKDAEKRFSTGWAKAEATFREPLPEDPGEVDVDKIPF